MSLEMLRLHTPLCHLGLWPSGAVLDRDRKNVRADLYDTLDSVLTGKSSPKDVRHLVLFSFSELCVLPRPIMYAHVEHCPPSVKVLAMIPFAPTDHPLDAASVTDSLMLTILKNRHSFVPMRYCFFLSHDCHRLCNHTLA